MRMRKQIHRTAAQLSAFVSDLVGNHEDRFSHDAADIV